jgi:hypothetical protein
MQGVTLWTCRGPFKRGPEVELLWLGSSRSLIFDKACNSLFRTLKSSMSMGCARWWQGLSSQTVQALLCDTQLPLLHLYKSEAPWKSEAESRELSGRAFFASCTPRIAAATQNWPKYTDFQSMLIISRWSFHQRIEKDWIRQLLETGQDINWLSIP